MSFSLTTPQFLNGTKTVTRRLGWKNLKINDLIMAVEKSQGLKKGEKVKRLDVIKILSIKSEALYSIRKSDVVKEGFPAWHRIDFICFFAQSNNCENHHIVQRIEFERLHVKADQL